MSPSRISIFALLSLASVALAGTQKGMIEIGTVKGQANLLVGERRAPLTLKLSFAAEGKKIETLEKSSVELILSNGAMLTVSENSLVEVQTFTQVASPLIVPGKYRDLSAEPSPSVVVIEVHKGKVTGEARKLTTNSQFTIKTPLGVSRIRGTVWKLMYEERPLVLGKMNTECATGSVVVTPSQQGLSAVNLAPGEGVEITGAPVVIVEGLPLVADINGDGIPDVLVSTKGNGFADAIDVNGDGKPDTLVSSKGDGVIDGVDLGNGKIVPIKVPDAKGSLVALDKNGDGIPDVLVVITPSAKPDEPPTVVESKLIYPPALTPGGKPIEVLPTSNTPPTTVKLYTPPPDPTLPPEPPAPPAPPAPPPAPPLPKPPAPNPNPTIDNIVKKETQEPVSPSGG